MSKTRGVIAPLEPEPPALLVPALIASQVSAARGPAVAARVGIALGISITLCFLTGLISHWIQHPPTWFYWPAHPVWLYRVTQGAHVISGVIAIPLLLVKLWAVFPRLFSRPLIGNPLRMLERGSIALLVGSVIFQLVTGLFNTAQFYPWKFFFTTTHYAMSYVAVGALAIHLAVKLPIIRTALARPLAKPAAVSGPALAPELESAVEQGDSPAMRHTEPRDAGEPQQGQPAVSERTSARVLPENTAASDHSVATPPDVGIPPMPGAAASTAEPGAGHSHSDLVSERGGSRASDSSPTMPTTTPLPESAVVQHNSTSVAQPAISRRAVLSAAGIAAAVAGLAVAGQTIPFLRWVAVLSPRSGEGPQGLPVNRTAAAAGVGGRAQDSAYRLMVDVGGVRRAFSRAELAALPQSESTLPIACVEGWSASAHWSGVRLRDLLAAVGEYRSGDVRFESLESGGLYRTTVLPRRHAIDASTLVALRVNGEDLDLDHGYPCRLIAPNRPGVLQTKWLSTIEVLA
ncbi:molybdopterin-dependent oxidoreductase [Nocardia sp. NBC_01327]|uniref:molybdopterin-dependent oxidoreductase n=1 Tax=Nocardia sp. NBC_01327 TaxID=2903593 RepID=UPI003FA3B44C